MAKFSTLVVLCSVAAFGAPAAINGITARFANLPSGSNDRCDIKGNISIDSGERIYHVPGQKYYAATKISSQYGERWFCSEDDARVAGWRKSKQ